MRLTQQTDYAFRMLIYLAVHRERSGPVQDVAENYGISRSHLLKVALKLGRLGYVKTARGRSGGIALARAPEDINLGEVIRAMEDDLGLVECMRSDGGQCVISPACNLKKLVGRALTAFVAVFDGVTLAELTHNRSELLKLLEIKQFSARVA